MYLPVGWTHVTARMICQDRSFTSSIKRIICNCCELDNVNSQQSATETPHRFLLNILSGRLSFTMQKIWFKNNNQNLIHQLWSDSAPIIVYSCHSFAVVFETWMILLTQWLRLAGIWCHPNFAIFFGFWQFWFLVIAWRKLAHCSSTVCRQHSWLFAFPEISNVDETIAFHLKNDCLQDGNSDIQMCQFCFVLSYHADVLFMFVESLFHPFRSKYLRRKLRQTGLYFKEG